jgi:hypothetical protein
MEVGQRVRVSAASNVARGLDLPHGAQGTVICTYRLLTGTQAASGRLDVRFSPRVRVVAWGVPESAFEPIDP